MSAFTKNALAALQQVVDFMFRIDDMELAKIIYTFQPFLFHFSNVVLEVQRTEDGFVACLASSIFLFKVFKDVAYTETVT